LEPEAYRETMALVRAKDSQGLWATTGRKDVSPNPLLTLASGPQNCEDTCLCFKVPTWDDLFGQHWQMGTDCKPGPFVRLP
jgi:hypothetical protein